MKHCKRENVEMQGNSCGMHYASESGGIVERAEERRATLN